MAQDQIRYDILAQDALRGVMRKVLSEVSRTGLPGAHHFFITFLTNAPGVRISSRLHAKYPEQMTIVLQYQYWDLEVTETGFSIGLSFSDTPEKLEVPYSAVRGFYDPSVNFELEFDVNVDETEDASNKIAELAPVAAPADNESDEEKSAPVVTQISATEHEHDGKSDKKDGDDGSSAEVVSLDSFRKK